MSRMIRGMMGAAALALLSPALAPAQTGADTTRVPADTVAAALPPPAADGPFTVEVSGTLPARPARAEVVWLAPIAAAPPVADTAADRTPPAARAPARPAPRARVAPRRHVVARGDTLLGLARRYGVTAEAIRRANDLADDRIRIGQTLVIPAPR